VPPDEGRAAGEPSAAADGSAPGADAPEPVEASSDPPPAPPATSATTERAERAAIVARAAGERAAVAARAAAERALAARSATAAAGSAAAAGSPAPPTTVPPAGNADDPPAFGRTTADLSQTHAPAPTESPDDGAWFEAAPAPPEPVVADSVPPVVTTTPTVPAADVRLADPAAPPAAPRKKAPAPPPPAAGPPDPGVRTATPGAETGFTTVTAPATSSGEDRAERREAPRWLAVAGLIVAAWAALPRFFTPALDTDNLVELVDHVVPGLVVFAVCLGAVLVQRQPGRGGNQLFLGGLVLVLAGLWMVATHLPLVAQAMRDEAPWAGTIYHSASALSVFGFSLIWMAANWNAGEFS